MKENKIVKFTTLVLLITIVAVSLVSGTYARYTSTVTGEDTAIVAKWDVSAGDASGKFDVFNISAIYDTEGTAETDDEDVRNAEGTNPAIIAPGTWGKFSYTITNDSDVSAKYAVDYTVNEAGVPLQWSTDGTNWTTDLADIAESDDTKIAIDGEDVTKTIYWKWAISTNDVETAQTDAEDTILGEAGTATPTIEVKVTFTQVD